MRTGIQISTVKKFPLLFLSCNIMIAVYTFELFHEYVYTLPVLSDQSHLTLEVLT